MQASFQRLTGLVGAATILGTCVSAAAAQDSARLPSPPPKAPVVSGPRWDRAPHAEFPLTARTAGVEAGAVTLFCAVTPQGLTKDCVVVDETPPGVGFADSALAAMPSATLFPQTVDGQEVSSTIRFTIRFAFRDTPPAAPPAG